VEVRVFSTAPFEVALFVWNKPAKKAPWEAMGLFFIEFSER
jgi:hypothetical protein